MSEDIKIHVEIGENLRAVMTKTIDSVDTYVSPDDAGKLMDKMFNSIREFVVDIIVENNKKEKAEKS